MAHPSLQRTAHRAVARTAVVLGAVALGVSACGTTPPTTPGAGTTASTGAGLVVPPTAGSTFAAPNCLELGKAVETITTTADPVAADAAVAAIAAYDPPESVIASLDTLRDAVDTNTANESTADASSIVFSWVTSACPTR